VRGQADAIRNNPDAVPSFRRFNKNLLYKGLVSWQKGLTAGEFRSSLLPASGTGDAINGFKQGFNVRLCERYGGDLRKPALIAVLARQIALVCGANGETKRIVELRGPEGSGQFVKEMGFLVC
jgi:hypothetical protein